MFKDRTAKAVSSVGLTQEVLLFLKLHLLCDSLRLPRTTALSKHSIALRTVCWTLCSVLLPLPEEY